MQRPGRRISMIFVCLFFYTRVDDRKLWQDSQNITSPCWYLLPWWNLYLFNLSIIEKSQRKSPPNQENLTTVLIKTADFFKIVPHICVASTSKCCLKLQQTSNLYSWKLRISVTNRVSQWSWGTFIFHIVISATLSIRPSHAWIFPRVTVSF